MEAIQTSQASNLLPQTDLLQDHLEVRLWRGLSAALVSFFLTFSLSLFILVVATVQCRTELVEGADRCFVVNGGITMNGSKDIAWVVPVVLDLISFSMNQGMLNNVHEDVIDVRFLNPGIESGIDVGLSPTPSPTQDLGNVGSDRDGTNTEYNEPWPWIVLGFGIVLLISVAFLIQRRLRSIRKEQEEYDEVSRVTPPDDPYLKDGGRYVNPSAASLPVISLDTNEPDIFIDDDLEQNDSFEQRRRYFH